MKKTDLPEFHDFMLDEATKYGRAITKPEIDTWFETFGRATIADFRAAWIEHKRDEKDGKWFPKITDLQRRLRTAGDGARGAHDHRCIWNGNGDRCKYVCAFFAPGAREGMCIFHRAMSSGPGAQIVCDESQDATPAQYLERAKAHVYGKQAPKAVEVVQKRIEHVKAGGHVSLFVERILPEREPGADEDEAGRAEADARVAAADAVRIEEINRELALAQQRAAE